jgi:hypothetical protein
MNRILEKIAVITVRLITFTSCKDSGQNNVGVGMT